MKKLYILLLFVMSLLSINETNALWYGKTATGYTDSPIIKECPSDGDTTGGYATSYTKDRAVTTSAGTSPITSEIAVSPTGTMYCLKWDNSVPVIGYTLSGGTTTTDTRTNANVTASISCSDQGGSLCASSTYQYRVETSPFTCNSAGTWTNGSSVAFTPPSGTNLVRYVCFRGKDRAQNENSSAYTSYSSVAIIKIDKITPAISDITNSNPTNLLATKSYNYGISVSINGGSPIISVSGRKENSADESTLSMIDYTLTSIPWTQIWDIHQVDNYRTGNGGRLYEFNIDKICDEAGNCSTWNAKYDYYVYSNTLNLGTTAVTTNQLTSGIADGTRKDLIVTLNDTYGNDIIQATGIGRTIDINWNVINRMYLNQINRSGAKSVYVTKANSGIYSNTSLSTSSSFNGETSTGTYTYGFKFYTPTSNQDNGPLSDPNAEFTINGMNFDVNGSLGTVSGQSIGSSTITAKMSPMYYSEIQGEMKTNGIIEGAVQTGSIRIRKNGTSTGSNNKIFIEFGSGDTNVVNPKLNLQYGTTDINVTTPVSEGKLNATNTIFKNPFSATTYNIYTKLLMQTGATINDIQNSYFATHIGYDISEPNGAGSINPLYNSDVYGKESYFGATGTGNTYGSAVKIVGETYSQSYNEILSGQEGSDVKLIEGSISKVGMKTDVRKNVFNLTRGVTISNSGNLVDDFNFTNNEDGAELLNGTLLYFGNEGGANVTIQAGTVNGNKTIVVEGGNIYITGNIDTTGVDSILGLVALKDDNGNGGNIYINPSVSYIKAVMYADKSVISYDEPNELGGNATFSDLKNQLYIYGSLFSENTVGGSRANPIKCPYYITTCTSIEEAQKYDLNYLRRYYITDTNSDGVADAPAGGSGTVYFSSISQYYQYPVVIEYNPLIQTNPPIVFK